MVNIIYKFFDRFIPKNEKEIQLDKRLKAIEEMQERMELYECKKSIKTHFTTLIPVKHMDDLQSKKDFLCNGNIHSENYQLIIDSLISRYSGKADEFVTNLMKFKLNYQKSYTWIDSGMN